jgi:GNAT superfamily N-acetyltransferase
MSPRLRPGTPADLDALVEGNLAMALETEGLHLHPPTLRAGVARALGGGVGARYLIAEDPDDGRILGQLMLTTEWSDWRDREVWWIQSVYVWPAARRRGVYRALAAEAARQARAAGAGGLRLYVDRRNTAAQQVYTRLGMVGDHYLTFEQMFPSPPGDPPAGDPPAGDPR